MKDGGPAFPTRNEFFPNGDGSLLNTAEYESRECGMSLRDYFAAQAIAQAMQFQMLNIQSLIQTKVLSVKDAESEEIRSATNEGVATMAYCIADAMLAERSKEAT